MVEMSEEEEKLKPAPKDESGGEPPSRKSDPYALTTRLVPPASGSPVSSEPVESGYTMLKKIADGGMGVVFLGKDEKLSRHVAIKRLRPATLTDPSSRDRFFQEAKSIAALSHVNIVQVFSLGEDDEGPYIVMEYVAGPASASQGINPPLPFSLADRIHRDGPLPADQALELLVKLSKAIEYAHSCGVIHRDLKPSNVLFSENGTPKIVDFGLARRQSDGSEKLTVQGEKMLSLGYGAPEQEHDASKTDERADVYGLGALLFFALTGRNPRYFRESDLPEAIRMPIVKALETDREKRWPSAAQFTRALMLIQNPTSIELPTVKSTWRCKWCDTVNPVAIQHCGECGWDGRVDCIECGSESRTGIPFCGRCGADAREYETARQLTMKLQQFFDDKAYDQVLQSSGQISGFQPVGPNGQKIVRKVRSLEGAAERAQQRVKELLKMIPQEFAAHNYSDAARHIMEYDSLADDNAFEEQKKLIPNLSLERELALIREAVSDRQWDYAARMCQRMLSESPSDSREVDQLLRTIRANRRRLHIRNGLIAVLAVFFGYVFSAAPFYGLIRPKRDSSFHSVFGFAKHLYAAGILHVPLQKYASLCGAGEMYHIEESVMLVEPGTALPSVADRIGQVALLKAKYQAALSNAEKDFQKKMSEWPARYKKELTNLRNRMQQRGYFQAWVDIGGELDRFEASGLIEEADLVPEPHELKSLQQRYMRSTAGAAIERARRVVSDTENYVKSLRNLQRNVTKQGKMQKAMAIDAEIKRVEASLLVTAAKAEVKADADRREAAKKADAAKTG